jgi:hypothetical protein
MITNLRKLAAQTTARREALDVTATAFEQLADRLDRRVTIYGEVYEPGTLTALRVLRYEVRMVSKAMRAVMK